MLERWRALPLALFWKFIVMVHAMIWMTEVVSKLLFQRVIRPTVTPTYGEKAKETTRDSNRWWKSKGVQMSWAEFFQIKMIKITSLRFLQADDQTSTFSDFCHDSISFVLWVNSSYIPHQNFNWSITHMEMCGGKIRGGKLCVNLIDKIKKETTDRNW